MKSGVVGVLLCLVVAASFAQVPVFVASAAPDAVGSRLVYAIKEGIRRSASMQLVDRSQDGRFIVEFVSLDPQRATANAGYQTVYSVVLVGLTFHSVPVPMYLTNFVGTCGSGRVPECADGVVASVDEQVSALRAIIKSGSEAVKPR